MTLSNNLVCLSLFSSFQSIVVFSQDYSPEEARALLEEKFVREFPEHLDIGDALVWKISKDIEKFKLQNYDKGFTAFQSNETFLILAEKRKSGCLNIYCWSGKNTTLEDKKTVAKQAMIFYHLISDAYENVDRIFRFSREYESFETESFMHTIHRLKKNRELVERDEFFRDDYLPLKGSNLYIIKGDEKTTCIKKVPISHQWVRPDSCVLFETGRSFPKYYPATICCGKEASEKVRRRVEILARTEIVRPPSDEENFTVKFVPHEGYKFEEFNRFLEYWWVKRPSDVDNSNDYLKDNNIFCNKRREAIKIFEISSTYGQGKLEISRNPIIRRMFSNKKNYLFDSESVAGLSFLFGYNAALEPKIWAAQYAEQYLHDKMKAFGITIPMRMMSSYANYFHFDFLINLQNIPYNYMEDEITPEIW